MIYAAEAPRRSDRSLRRMARRRRLAGGGRSATMKLMVRGPLTGGP